MFLGEVISSDEDGKFLFSIIEIFKGDKNIREIEGQLFSSCSFSPDKGEGQWIVYGIINNGKIDISQCGVTRSYSNPHIIMSSTYPPPLPGMNEFQYKKYIEKLRKSAQADWKEELKMLREQKDKN